MGRRGGGGGGGRLRRLEEGTGFPKTEVASCEP